MDFCTWSRRRAEFTLPIEEPRQFNQNIEGVLARPTIERVDHCQYDHEVQGSSIIKPLVGVDRADRLICRANSWPWGGSPVVSIPATVTVYTPAAGIEESLRNLMGC